MRIQLWIPTFRASHRGLSALSETSSSPHGCSLSSGLFSDAHRRTAGLQEKLQEGNLGAQDIHIF